jgi:hypothetical protein
MAAIWNRIWRGEPSRELAPDTRLGTRCRPALGAAALFCAVACAPSPPAAAPDTPASTERQEATGGEVWGAGTPAASAAPTASDGDAPETPGASSDDGLDADIAALSASTQTASAAQPSSVEPKAPGESIAGREIVYRVTPKGLVIEVDGFHLRPEAKPFKDKNGAYGIQLVVNAESFDGRQYWVNKPKEGPLSIAGKVEGQGKVSRFGDQREGSGEEPVLEGNPRRFEQRWPGRGQPKLWSGQTVTLEVGLWGVRVGSERERPVRRLFVVKMVAGPRSQAVVTPPTMDWGT